jgi:DNA helicase-2/ATP-dependent DNA helicase PcrA
MVAVGKARVYSDPTRHVVATTAIRGILDYFLPALRGLGIPHGDATVLSSSWTPLFPLARALRDQGISVVGPGARPYRRGRLFAPLAEHLCGYLVDPTPNSLPSIERSLFHVVQEITGRPRFSIFSYAGRVIVLKIAAVAAEIAASDDNALRWLDHASQAIGVVLAENDLIGPSQAPLLFTSVQEMKSDMRRSISSIDPSAYRLSDLGLFASPEKALKLSTLHFAKGREFDAVAMINLHEGAIPFFQARMAEDFEEAKRLFYVGVTRPRRLLMYVTDMSDRRNQPTRFLGASGVGIIS